MSFTDKDRVMLFLSKEALTPLQDAQADMLIEMVDGVIENYCGWKILASDYVGLEFDGNGLAELDLQVYPINTVTTVLLDGTDITTDVKVNKPGGTLIYTGNTFTTGRLNVSVDFNAGFTPDKIPTDLTYVATFLVVHNMNRIALKMVGVKSGKHEDTSIEFDTTDLPKTVTNTLDRYRLLRVF